MKRRMSTRARPRMRSIASRRPQSRSCMSRRARFALPRASSASKENTSLTAIVQRDEAHGFQVRGVPGDRRNLRACDPLAEGEARTHADRLASKQDVGEEVDSTEYRTHALGTSAHSSLFGSPGRLRIDRRLAGLRCAGCRRRMVLTIRSGLCVYKSGEHSNSIQPISGGRRRAARVSRCRASASPTRARASVGRVSAHDRHVAAAKAPYEAGGVALRCAWA